MKYYYQIEGLLRNNIGDVLQGIVAKDFLPESDQLNVVDRENLSGIDEHNQGLLIANGWYMHSFDKFPPPDNITPLYVSVHIANSKLLLNKKVREHFYKFSPIGCRDTKTKQLFLGWGIPAYYSGCLTVTCKTRSPINNLNTGEVLLVDNIDHPIPNAIKDKLEKYFNANLIRISHDPVDTSGTVDEYNKVIQSQMEDLLKRYCNAKLVITTKIHCALPCLGMGANVMLIHPNPLDPRLDTVKEFIKISSYEDILAGNISIPKVNKKKLNERQSFLSTIVEQSIKNNTNIVSSSTDFIYRFIRVKSLVESFFYKRLVLIMYHLGIKRSQIQKVYQLN